MTCSNSSKVKKQQRVIQVTAAERTQGRDEPAHIARPERGTSSSSTWFSSEVSHPGTNQAQPCLASVGD